MGGGCIRLTFTSQQQRLRQIPLSDPEKLNKDVGRRAILQATCRASQVMGTPFFSFSNMNLKLISIGVRGLIGRPFATHVK